MRRPFLAALFAVLPLCLTVFAAGARADTVVVFAAASLKTALDDVAEGFSLATGDEVVLSVAGSSALARQIQLGAPADVFISANEGWMDALEASGHIAPETRRDLLGNRLVMISARGAAAPVKLAPGFDLAGRLGRGHLAMALVEAVPVGIYGKAALESLGLWTSVAPRVAQVDNSRAALALVATGAAPLGIVYATDAKADPRVEVLATFPAESHPPIVYPVAAVAGRLTPATEAFVAYLGSDAARAAFEAQGFSVRAGGD